MIKKTPIILVLLIEIIFSTSYAQQLELHYDTRHSLYGSQIAERNYLTGTFEIFKPDTLGSNFVLFDLNFDMFKGNIGMIYTEIARDFQIGCFPIMPHIEFNGGLGNGFLINNSLLVGGSHNIFWKSWVLNTYFAYKLHLFECLSHDIQWTFIWSKDMLNDKLSFSGFFDLWTENIDHTSGSNGKKLIFMTEPQLWYNISKSFSFGTELRLTYNFLDEKRWFAIPTVAVKYRF